MHLRLHLPASIDMQNGSLQQQRRLQQVIAQSFKRAVTMLSLSHVQIELVQTGIQSGVDAVEPATARVQRGADPVGSVQVEIGNHSEHFQLARLPEVAVLRNSEGSFRYVGTCRCVEAKNLAQAFVQGASFFDRSGYAVLQSRETGRFYAAQFTGSRQQDQCMQPGELILLESVPGNTPQEHVVVAYGGRATNTPQEHAVVAYGGRDGQTDFSSPADERAVNYAAVRGATTHGRGGMIDLIVMMDRSLFAQMPWEKWVEYLLLLTYPGMGKPEMHAIWEIIASSRSSAEVAAIFALLRERGKHEQLFQDLDERIYDLLRLLAEFDDDQALDWRYPVSLLLDMQMLPAASPLIGLDSLHWLQGAARRLHAWLRDMQDDASLRFGDTDDDDSLAYLAEFLWIVEQARQGDLRAQEFATQMVIRAGTGSIQALCGLRYVEQLTRPVMMKRNDQPGERMNRRERLCEQIRSILIRDLLAWFIDSDAFRPARQNRANLPQCLDALKVALETWRPQGADIAGIEPGSSQRLQRCITSAGGLTAQMVNGVQALLKYTTWDQETILDLIESLPSTSVKAFLSAMMFIGPAYLERWDVSTLKALAAHPAALAFIREAGCDLMLITRKRVGASWEALDVFLRKLAIRRERTGNALDYRWFLYRMEKGEEGAFAEVAALELHDVQPGSARSDEKTQWQP